MMSIPRFRKLILCGLVAALLTACGTTQDHRIRVYPRDFNALEDPTRQLIREGRIEPGFSSRMVYMALGDPRTVERRDTEDGELVTWTFKGFIREEENGEVYFQTTNDLIWGSPFARQAYDRLRVVFFRNEVITIQTIPRPT